MQDSLPDPPAGGFRRTRRTLGTICGKVKYEI